MSAIERCRSAALGGHLLLCQSCQQSQIAYNSCRNRHCPKCQGSAALRWLEDRQADLLPVAYYHLTWSATARRYGDWNWGGAAGGDGGSAGLGAHSVMLAPPAVSSLEAWTTPALHPISGARLHLHGQASTNP